MGNIQEQPVGLLSLLGIRGEGNANPISLSQVLQPTIDLLEQYSQLRKETAQLTFVDAVPVAGTTRVLTVPANELWYVHAFTCSFVMPGAGSTRAQTVRFAPDGGVYDAGPPQVVGAGELAYLEPFARDFWLMPAEQVGWRFVTVPGIVANVTGQFVNLVRTRYRI